MLIAPSLLTTEPVENARRICQGFALISIASGVSYKHFAATRLVPLSAMAFSQ